jgi:hypothetical protein
VITLPCTSKQCVLTLKGSSCQYKGIPDDSIVKLAIVKLTMVAMGQKMAGVHAALSLFLSFITSMRIVETDAERDQFRLQYVKCEVSSV